MAAEHAASGIPEEDSPSLLRPHGERAERVTSIELFFDLVFVFAVTQLSHLLLDHLTPHGALQTLLLLIAVWWAWIDTAWVTNWFDPNQSPVRLMLVGVMLGSLLMAAALPEAFGERGLLFAGAYAAIQVGRTLFVVASLRRGHTLRLTFQRLLVWSGTCAVLWVAGGLAEGTTRETLWLTAVAIECVAPMVGYVTPGLGRSRTSDWQISGGHLAERCQLFIIVVFGESILVTGSTFGQLPVSAPMLTAFVVAFVGSVALWWVYFVRAADLTSEAIASSDDPGRLGRSAYTYYHPPMVAGIILCAVADELMIAHPEAPGTATTVAVMLGGPALFLAGHALFKHAFGGHLMWSHVGGIVVLSALIPVGLALPAVTTGALAALAVVGVAVWDARVYRRITSRRG
jgi:low temperature requirement protein LtrA